MHIPYRGAKMEEEQTVSLKDKPSMDKLLIQINRMKNLLSTQFTMEIEPEIIVNADSSVSVMVYDVALLFIKHDTYQNVTCLVTIYDEADLIVIAELMIILKDVFKTHVYLNTDTFIQDMDDNLIFGRDNIDDHNEKCWGRKVAHSVMFADDMAGHS